MLRSGVIRDSEALDEIDELLVLVHAKLRVYVLDMRLRRTLSYLQVAHDDSQRTPARQQHEHLALARRQTPLDRYRLATPFQ